MRQLDLFSPPAPAQPQDGRARRALAHLAEHAEAADKRAPDASRDAVLRIVDALVTAGRRRGRP